jgi:hypothetical protein
MGILSGNKNTPLGQHHLCKSCASAQFMTGHRDSERLAICTNTSPNMVIPFAMVECSGFSDRNRPDGDQLEKLTIDVRPGGNTSKTARFRAAPSRPPGKSGEDGEVAQTRFLRN